MINVQTIRKLLFCAGTGLLPLLAWASPAEETELSSPRATSGKSSSSVDLPMLPGANENSKTVQILLEMQKSKTSLEAGERTAATIGTPKAPPPRPQLNATMPTQSPPQLQAPDVYKKALEQSKPAVNREWRAPTSSDTRTSRLVPVGATGDSHSAPEGGTGAPAQEGAVYRIAFIGDFIRFLRENRSSILVGSLLALMLVGFGTMRASQRTRR